MWEYTDPGAFHFSQLCGLNPTAWHAFHADRESCILFLSPSFCFSIWSLTMTVIVPPGFRVSKHFLYTRSISAFQIKSFISPMLSGCWLYSVILYSVFSCVNLSVPLDFIMEA